MMLKNELELWAADPYRQSIAGQAAIDRSLNFGEHIAASCGRAKEAWAAAAFSNYSDDTLRRYFDFHFRAVSGLIGNDQSFSLELCRLADHLLAYYGRFIDREQSLPAVYIHHRLGPLQKKCAELVERIRNAGTSKGLMTLFEGSILPLFTMEPLESHGLSELLYLETLIRKLTLCDIESADLQQELLNTLLSSNFNHLEFFSYLMTAARLELENIPGELWGGYLKEKSVAVQIALTHNNLAFDHHLSHIALMYKSWLHEQGDAFDLNKEVIAGQCVDKLTLQISVAGLGCMIRCLYESGVYGRASLTSIFEHTASVFSSKRQEQISADSLSNAYYNVNLSAAASVLDIFDKSRAFLRQRYFPA